MIRLCARWLYWRYWAYRAERSPSGATGRAFARFWCTLWLHPGDWFGWLKPLGKALAASPVPPIGALSVLHGGPPLDSGASLANMIGGAPAYTGSSTPLALNGILSELQAAQLGSPSHTPWPGLQQALANVPPEARGYSSQPSLLALLNSAPNQRGS
jgi:hypothetical protein